MGFLVAKDYYDSFVISSGDTKCLCVTGETELCDVRDNSIDSIICHHNGRVAPIDFKEVYRVLKRDSYFVEVFNTFSIPIDHYLCGIDSGFHCYTKRAISRIIQHNGLKLDVNRVLVFYKGPAVFVEGRGMKLLEVLEKIGGSRDE